MLNVGLVRLDIKLFENDNKVFSGYSLRKIKT